MSLWSEIKKTIAAELVHLASRVDADEVRALSRAVVTAERAVRSERARRAAL